MGARPQIIKSAALTRAVTGGYSEQIKLLTLHTGQHYDNDMSAIFFEELGLPKPDIQFELSAKSHAAQTSAMMINAEQTFLAHRPDIVLVYGDTNSTLAAALAAYKLQIPVAHVEAGLRSDNLKMPEETNRIATDHLSTWLFTPNTQASERLAQEGILSEAKRPSLARPGIYSVGDVMYDNSLHYGSDYESGTELILATCHRPSNVDDSAQLGQVLKALLELGSPETPVLLPVHPRLEKHEALLSSYRNRPGLILSAPLSYLDMQHTLKRAKAVITDSGGLQKEAYYHEKPCLILRDETEWPELMENGSARLVNLGRDNLIEVLGNLTRSEHTYPQVYGSGDAANLICDVLVKTYSTC